MERKIRLSKYNADQTPLGSLEFFITSTSFNQALIDILTFLQMHISDNQIQMLPSDFFLTMKTGDENNMYMTLEVLP